MTRQVAGPADGPARPHTPGPVPGPPIGPVAERLHALMRDAGVNQSELGRRSGVPQSRISALMCGHVRYPRVARLRRLAEALGARPDALTEGMGLEPIRIMTPAGYVEAYDLGDTAAEDDPAEGPSAA